MRLFFHQGVTMSAAWFVDGEYVNKIWQSLNRNDYLDYVKLRQHLETTYCDAAIKERIEDAYYFKADADLPTERTNAYHNVLAYPPPIGPGFRVKLEWLSKKKLFWPKALGGGPVLHPTTGAQYELTQQKAVDVSLAFHLTLSYSNRKWRKLFFAAGDGDFKTPIQYLVEFENVDLILIGSMSTISEELRPYARDIVKLDEMADQLARAKPQAKQP
jgi:uncharacterized LabA/DUF88 family protein